MKYPAQFVFDEITLPLAHQDERRAIYERNVGNTAAIQHILIANEVTESVVLGNHYHLRSEEVFTIEEGGGMLYTRLVNEQGQPTAGQVMTQLKAGDHVFIPRLMAHTFVMQPGSRMSCIRIQRPSNDSGPDMLSCQLVG